MDELAIPSRGVSQTSMRDVRCKDCLREAEQAPADPSSTHFEYSETWAQRLVDRGGSRTDRCARHRKVHRQAIQGIAVAYIDLETIGEVADRNNPRGPLGGLGELPDRHEPKRTEVDLAQFEFGMTDDDILEIIRLLSSKQVLILKAGTGTGKSTFAPFRLLNPPAGAVTRPCDAGPIVVTEPRVQATIGVARFVGEKLVRGCSWQSCTRHGWFESEHPGPLADSCVLSECSRHIGPGYPVGYQVKGDKNHDRSCQLIYATDGTVLNWLRDGRLSQIGTLIIDEAHERSTNIDFILGYLKKEIDRFPHLRLIVTSATVDVGFYVDYFGGSEKVASKELPSVKSFGYGAPLFPSHPDQPLPCACADEHGRCATMSDWLRTHWPEQMGPQLDDGFREDVWDTTRKLHELRFDRLIQADQWRLQMPDALGDFIARLTAALDELGIFGDILAFLATEKTIMPVVESLRRAISADAADVYPLLATADAKIKEAALAARPRGSKRKIVISTNIAETSLTVTGVRFIVDSGLICQEEWHPGTASRDLPTKPHSQSGLRQRWGRVGRDGPGWVFPLYSVDQFASLPHETPPGSTRSNLEQLVMKAKAGGIDDPLTFPWPAAHIAEGVELDDSARQAVDGFRAEIARSVQAATANGIVDTDGHLTVFGKELERFSGHGSAAFAVSVMLADQLACLPEVVTALALLEDRSILGRPKDRRRFLLPENEKWPTEWRVQARQRHEALYSQCQDDLDAALRIAAAWERSDSEPPWKNTARRREWAAGWWVEHDVLLAAAAHRREILGLLSPRMSEEVKRFLEPRLVPRARAAISRAMQSLEFELQEDGTYRSKSEVAQAVATVDRTSLLQNRPSRVIALQRRLLVSGDISIQSLIELLPWAADDAPEPMELIRRCAERCSPRSLPPASVDRLPPFIASWPVGGRYLAAFSRDAASDVRIAQIEAYIPPFAYTPDVEARAHADEQVEEPQAVGDAAEAEASSLAPDLVAESNISAEEAADVDVQWPGGSPDPEEDEEVVDRFTVLDPEDAESGLESNDEASAAEGSQLARDVLADWEALANESNVGRPAVRPPLDITPDTGDRTWVVCEGYEVGVSGLPQVCLGVDWLDPTTTGDPSLHTDLVIGDEVSVRVGPIVTDGRMNFRTFLRMDGRGRFLVPEFSDRRRNEPPVAVDPHDRQLLRTLNADAHPRATVVPGPAATRTISLLPGLAQHLDAAAKEQLVPSGGRTSSRFPFWRAVVAEPPAADGWARIELQHGDIDLGIRHTFGVTPSVSGGDQIAWDIGTELLVQLEFGPPARLVGGRRELLEDVAERFPRVVFLGDDRDARGPAPKLLMSRRQLTTAVRDALLGERPSASWERRVWDFFLSSHQRRIRSVLSATAGSDRQATQRVAPKVDAYVEFRVGQAVTGTVLEVSDAGLRIGFRNGATGFAGGRGLPSNTAYQIGDLATGIVHEVRPEAGRLILNLAAPGHVVTARLAAHWQDVLPASRARVVSYLSEDLTVSSGTLSVACGSTEHALAVAVRFTELLQLPAAQVDVPSERRGKVVGTKGATIKDLQAMQGVVACSLADDGTLTIIAESSDALRECLRRVVTMCTSRATAVMTVPNTSASGAIIGKGGETIRRLRSASGCTFADTVRGTTEWTLKAGSADAILRFLALANEIAPGCDLPIFEADEPKILDIGAEYIVEDWRHHDFAAVQLGDGQRPQYLPPVDLRLDG